MPPLERVKFSADRKDRFRQWLHHELANTIGDRGELNTKWSNAIIQWRAQLPDEDLEHPFPGAPYSRDTEILTRLGWKRVDEVEIGEYVLTRRDKDGTLEWNPVKARPSVWAPELLHFKSRTVDLMVTPAHTMVVENQRRETKRLKASEIWEKHGYKIPLTGIFEGVDTEKLFDLDAGDVSEFVGWYIAEGWTYDGGTIGLAQKKEHGRRAIQTLLDRLGFKYTIRDKGFSIHARTVPQELRSWLDMGVCDEKRVPGFYYGASPRLIKRLLDGMIGGDGNVRYKPEGNKPVITYYTTSLGLADDVQALAQLLGMRASITSRDRTKERVPAGGIIGGRQIEAKRTNYTVSILHRDRAKLKPHHSHEVVEYNDFAYCVTVDNHAVYVRRNGKAAFCGNSNLEFPLTAIHSDPVMADMLQTLDAPEDYWHATAKRPDRVDHANAVREGMTALERRFIKMRRVNERALMDNNILGTAIYKNHWKERRKTVKDYQPDGTIGDRLKRVSKPEIEHVPLQRFYIPANVWRIDPDEQGGARWVAQEFFVTPSQLRAWANGSSNLPAFDRKAVEHVLKLIVDRDPDVDDTIREEDDYTPFHDRKIRLFEVWARFDVDGDGIDEDVVAIVHHESLELLRVIHTPFLHGKRPFHKTNYLPGFGFYGLGISEIDEWAQETSTKLLNAQIDNILLANTRMYAAPLGSNVQPNEPVYPGKVWYVGPNEEIGEIKMSEVYPSIFQGLSQMLQFAEMRTGVSEIRQGNLTGLPSRTPATSLLSILREGNKRFDMILSGIRDSHGEMGLRMLQNVSQHFRDDREKWINYFTQALGEEDAARFLEVINGPVHEIEEAFGVAVTATSAQANKEVEKQSFVGLMQIVSQIYGQLVQTAQLAATAPDPLTKQTATAAYRAGTQLLQQLLERFDVQNPSQYLPNLQALSGSMQAQQQGANPATMGLMGGAQQIPPQAGVAPQQMGSIFGL